MKFLRIFVIMLLWPIMLNSQVIFHGTFKNKPFEYILENLKDDNIVDNCLYACEYLYDNRYNYKEELINNLSNTDYQVRMCVTRILMEVKDYKPTDLFYKNVFDGLKDDDLTRGHGYARQSIPFKNEWDFATYLNVNYTNLKNRIINKIANIKGKRETQTLALLLNILARHNELDIVKDKIDYEFLITNLKDDSDDWDASPQNALWASYCLLILYPYSKSIIDKYLKNPLDTQQKYYLKRTMYCLDEVSYKGKLLKNLDKVKLARMGIFTVTYFRKKIMIFDQFIPATINNRPAYWNKVFP